jgi:hypothetical protein
MEEKQMNSYESDDQLSKKRSLGKLRRNSKTKDKSPDLVGQLKLQRHTFDAIAKQFAEQGGDEVDCNLAGWVNRDANGEYLTTEISPRYGSQRIEPPVRSNLRFIFDDAEETN